MLIEHFFDDRESASAAAATLIAGRLQEGLGGQAGTTLVVSGGTTPAACFEQLAKTPLDWSRVTVLLSDERYVEPEHFDSNERLVRRTLLTGSAAAAHVVSVYQADMTVHEACDALAKSRPELRPACALLGMGADGHFASLFPDADRLAEGLRTDGEGFYIPITTAASPHARVSLTLAYLLQSNTIVLLFFGDEKRAVYEAAKSGADLPVAKLLENTSPDMHVIWAP